MNVLVGLVHFLVSTERNQDILMGHGWGRGCDGEVMCRRKINEFIPLLYKLLEEYPS